MGFGHSLGNFLLFLNLDFVDSEEIAVDRNRYLMKPLSVGIHVAVNNKKREKISHRVRAEDFEVLRNQIVPGPY